MPFSEVSLNPFLLENRFLTILARQTHFLKNVSRKPLLKFLQERTFSEQSLLQPSSVYLFLPVWHPEDFLQTAFQTPARQLHDPH